MTPAEITQAVAALSGIAKILDQLGIPGLIALALIGPALVIIAVLSIEYRRSREMQHMLEDVRKENRALLETYRADAQRMIGELGAHQRQTDGYYKDNVRLVEDYARIAGDLQDVVIGNTRAVERLTVMLEERSRTK